MNSVPKTQENLIMKFIEGVKLLFETLAEPGDNRTSEEKVKKSGISELQRPLQAEKILEEVSRGKVVKKVEVSEAKAAEALKQQGTIIQEGEIEKE